MDTSENPDRPEKVEAIEKMVYKNHSNPTVFSDGFHVSGRKDGLVLIEFYSNLPGRKIENFRTMITNEGAIKLSAALAKAKDAIKFQFRPEVNSPPAK